ncbi:putative reverse transcriptase domain-containing protein, partial [Tanacetum coccineum]
MDLSGIGQSGPGDTESKDIISMAVAGTIFGLPALTMKLSLPVGTTYLPEIVSADNKISISKLETYLGTLSECDWEFEIGFLTLFFSIFGQGSKDDTINERIIPYLANTDKVSEMDWCSNAKECMIKECTDFSPSSSFIGPLLLMAIKKEESTEDIFEKNEDFKSKSFEVFLQDLKLGFQDLLLGLDLLILGIDLVPVAPEVGAAAVASPAAVLELDTHSSSEADPSESSPPPVSVAPMVSPLLCSDDSESDTEIPERHVSPTTSIPEIPNAPILPAPSAIVAPLSEYPLAHVVALPEIRRRRAILIRPGEDIPIGRLYRTHPGGPCRTLTTRKLVRPLPFSFCMEVPHNISLDHFTSRSSSSHSSSDHSSSGHYISGHSLSRHTPLDTTDADLSTLPRFVHPSLAKTPRCSEAYLCWRSAPLSIMYPPTTSESSAGDSSSESSVGPSRKRCRSPAATVTSSIRATRALVPSRADLIPPRKRFRDSISLEDSVEEDLIQMCLVELWLMILAVRLRRVSPGIEVLWRFRSGCGSGIDIPNSMLMPDAIERLKQRIEDIKTGQRELVSRSLIAGGEKASLLDQVAFLERSNARLRGTMMMEKARADRRLETFANMTITRSGMTPKAIKELVNRRVEEALAAYEATHAANALEAKNQSQNSSNGDNGNGGNGNGENGNGGNENPNENNRDARPVARECTYQDFLKFQPLNFKGTEGVVGLAGGLRRWKQCSISAIRTIRAEAAFSMSWKELMKLMAKMVSEEEDRVEKFIGGLPDNIQGNLIAAEPIRLQDVPPFKRPNVRGQNVARAYTAGNNEKNRIMDRCLSATNVSHALRGQVVNQKVVTCFECGRQTHYRSDCTKLKDQNRGNKVGNKNGVGEARGKAYVLGVDRSFVSTTFSTLLDVTPDNLNVSYAVKLANGRISETNTVLKGCTLGLLGHPFYIDLMPVELGSFDVIIGMDWLANHHAVISLLVLHS